MCKPSGRGYFTIVMATNIFFDLSLAIIVDPRDDRGDIFEIEVDILFVTCSVFFVTPSLDEFV